MKLVFADKSTIDVLRIYGGKELRQGFERDVLTIEMEEGLWKLEEVKAMFQDSNKLGTLGTITKRSVPIEHGEGFETTEEENEIGVHYDIFLGLSYEFGSISVEPGLMPVLLQQEKIIRVRIAQKSPIEVVLDSLIKEKVIDKLEFDTRLAETARHFKLSSAGELG